MENPGKDWKREREAVWKVLEEEPEKCLTKAELKRRCKDLVPAAAFHTVMRCMVEREEVFEDIPPKRKNGAQPPTVYYLLDDVDELAPYSEVLAEQ